MIYRLLTASIIFASSALTAAERAAKPNIVIIFTDDQGYADVGCFGAKGLVTPNLDRLAKDGVRFTDFYVSQAVCSASRASLLTGCYSNRVGIHGALGPNANIGLNPEETTLAEVCKSRGYATGMVGKWHLGSRPEFFPTKQGFDSYLGLPYSNDMWPHHPEAKKGTYPNLPMYDGDTIVNPNVSPNDQSKLTAAYTERAVKFLGENKAKPFFLYVAHSMPHVPLFAGQSFRGKSERGIYGDVIQEIDASVGSILQALETHKLAENTLVIFTSDNGPWLSYGNHGGSAEPLREGKGTAWDGGVRVPMIARWPGVIPAGSICKEPAMTIDVLPTVAKFIGAELPKEKIDGLDIGPMLRGEPGAKCPHGAYYYYYHTNELHALRSGPWKLVLPHAYRTMQGQAPGKDGVPGKYKQAKIEKAQLFNLTSDVGESKDVAAENPGVVKKLLEYAELAREDLGDALTKRTGKGLREPGRAAKP